MLTHCHHLWDDGFVRPLDAKHFGQLLKILRRRFSNRKHWVSEPAHAERTKLLIEEFDSQLACQQRDVTNDGQSNSPLLVFC